ncbi:MAG TPA: type II toxin-antitoxin system RelE/ParE family toxin [Gemmatimonadota bacterium]|nr:type II toxin-antitoxin system RelE/ParE family toxin [Gemmatimonadota bacterium]
MTRQLRIPAAVAELVRGLHPGISRKIRAGLARLLEEPQAGKALKDELERMQSLRVARLRIVYRVGDDGVVEIVAVGPRQRIYEETLRLVRRGEP